MPHGHVLQKDISFAHAVQPIVRGLSLGRFRSLGPVFGPTLQTSRHTGCIQCTAHDVIANARKILDTTASDQDNTVLLKIMADTRDIRRDLELVRETNTRDFSQR